jgi:hypothetical protein
MSLNLVNEIWEVLSSHIDYNERKEAADTLINFLIDQNYDPEEIKDGFTGNKELLKALKMYLEEHDVGEEEEDYSEEDFDDEEWD